jgi:hypothetical protein
LHERREARVIFERGHEDFAHAGGTTTFVVRHKGFAHGVDLGIGCNRIGNAKKLALIDNSSTQLIIRQRMRIPTTISFAATTSGLKTAQDQLTSLPLLCLTMRELAIGLAHTLAFDPELTNQRLVGCA